MGMSKLQESSLFLPSDFRSTLSDWWNCRFL